MIVISHEILIQHYNMYLVCCKIFLKFLKFSGRCCGPDKLLVSRAMATLDVAVQYVAEIFFGGHCFSSFYTVCTDKGAQGTWCVMHSTWCTTGAVTCDKVG